jgi:chromosome partitioning protein
MAATVITVAQQKGGAGKTTVAAQLAAALAAAGRRVACIDIDPQGTLSAWAGIRAAGPFPPLEVATTQGWKLRLTLDEAARRHDVVIVDSPPHAETEARVAVRHADLVLIPCQPSLLDVWASRATMALVAAERGRALVVWNRVPSRGRIIEEAGAALAEAGVLPLAATLGNRSAFAASMHRGAGVVETEPRGRAADEVRAVVAALERVLGRP